MPRTTKKKPAFVIDPKYIHAAIAEVEAAIINDVSSYANTLPPCLAIMEREFGKDCDVEGPEAGAEYLGEIEYRHAELVALRSMLPG